MNMQQGTVKWFDATKGFGFIIPKESGADVFVHISIVKQSGLDVLQEGDPILYTLGVGKNGKTQAIKVELPE